MCQVLQDNNRYQTLPFLPLSTNKLACMHFYLFCTLHHPALHHTALNHKNVGYCNTVYSVYVLQDTMFYVYYASYILP